ncbi:hypothetical protein BS78_K233900 [Paspalum vaginatum]|uniref:Uncharacterized protein n=1 Tax=Paspalum vaginatum TaxID=158149 RepID=A0A9W8CGS0_9POAL|nr:hypothetical protein BS78_K233900 [Paspalum vaginatum]
MDKGQIWINRQVTWWMLLVDVATKSRDLGPGDQHQPEVAQRAHLLRHLLAQPGIKVSWKPAVVEDSSGKGLSRALRS